ncbi:collagen binding domain-containing protein [Streptococcus halichoeri]|uniref:MSCRAMM family protein n=1 Tax=Streptococcus halichoeri TaxID=254785 RepID=UPI0013569233|nr:SpaA isopeptide-forming pilin-related protein [Streptococcus halichoeri]
MHKILTYCCSFIMLVGVILGFTQASHADETNKRLIVVHLEARDIDRPNPKLDIEPKSGKAVSGVTYRIYQVADSLDADQLDRLDKQSITSLDKTTKANYQAVTNGQGQAVFSDLPAGLYYGVPIKDGQRNQSLTSFLVELRANQVKDKFIYPKVIWQTGSVHLQKLGIAGTATSPLAGVTFELYEKNGMAPLRVKNGLHSYELDARSQLTTDKEGKLVVSGLIPGDYYFKEIKTVSGYKIDQAKIPFTITNHGKKRLVIKNYKAITPPTHKFNFPLTSDQRTVFLVVIGCLLVGLALFLLRHYHKTSHKD